MDERTVAFIFNCAASAAGVSVEDLVAKGARSHSHWKQAAVHVARDLGIPVKVIARAVGLAESTVSGIALVANHQMRSPHPYPIQLAADGIRFALLPSDTMKDEQWI